MANKRMFSVSVINTDQFFEMTAKAQALYFHMAVRADDDGMLENPRTIARMCGASAAELELLETKGYIITFPSGVVAITHWFLHNTVQKDRQKPTIFQAELRQLRLVDNIYQLVDNSAEHEDNPFINDADQPEKQEESAEISSQEHAVSSSDTECIQNVFRTETECIQSASRQETDRKQDASKVDPQIRLKENRIDKYNTDQVSIGQHRSDQINTAEGRKDARAPARESPGITEEELNAMMDRRQLDDKARQSVLAFYRDTQKRRDGGINGVG